LGLNSFHRGIAGIQTTGPQTTNQALAEEKDLVILCAFLGWLSTPVLKKNGLEPSAGLLLGESSQFRKWGRITPYKPWILAIWKGSHNPILQARKLTMVITTYKVHRFFDPYK